MNQHSDVDRIQQSELDGDVDLSFLSYTRFLKKNRKRIFMYTALIYIVVTLYNLFLPNIYGTRVDIFHSSLSHRDEIPSHQELIYQSIKLDQVYFESELALLLSKKVQDQVKFDLRLGPNTQIVYKKPTIIDNMKSFISNKSMYVVNANRERETRLLYIQVTGPEPILCSKITNQFAKSYANISAEEKLFMPKKMFEWLLSSADDGSDLDEDNWNLLNENIRQISILREDPEIKPLYDRLIEVQIELRKKSSKYLPYHPSVKRLMEEERKTKLLLKELVTSFVAAFKDSLTTGENASSNLKIMNTAHPPTSPIGPNRFRNILLSTLIGFLAISLLVHLTEQYSHKIRFENDLPDFFKSPYLGSIPYIKVASGKKPKKGKSEDPLSIRDIFEQDPLIKDVVADIRTRILFSVPYEESKQIMISSTKNDEGKSTTAYLLAHSLAIMGRKILLMDADLRFPSIHSKLQISNEKGLTNYLSGDMKPSSIIQPSGVENLSIIAAGKPTMNAVSLLSSARFDDLLKKLSKDYDRIIIDTPPILQVPDALIIAKNIPCGILVSRSGVTTKRDLKQVQDNFLQMRRNLVGIIINWMDEKWENSDFADKYSKYRKIMRQNRKK